MRGLLILCCFVPYAWGETSRGERELTVLEKWEKLEKGVKVLTDEGIKFLLPKLMDGMANMNISTACAGDAMKIIAGVKKMKNWAFRFVDASAKMLDGMLTGRMSFFGAYDQCINTQAIDQRSGKRKGQVMFTGKYCYIDMKPPLPPKRKFYKLNEVLDELKNLSSRDTTTSEAAKFAHFFYFISFRFGVCVPSSCTKDDLYPLVAMVTDRLGFWGQVTRCEVKKEKEITTLMVAIMTAFSIAGFMMIVGTLFDLYCYHAKRNVKNVGLRLLKAFSFFSNFRKFVDTSTSSETLSCLNGIRFLSMSWVILGHSYFFINYQLFSGLETIRDFAKDFAFQAIVNASVAVDTFFFIGGLLVCYLITKHCKISGKPFNVTLYLIHRLWRIFPVYSAVIAFMFLTELLGDGPIWHETMHEAVQNCHENWWTNLIFINNFYHANKMCVPQSWYIACDMQLYIAALIVVLPLMRWPKVGISIAVAAILASMVSSGLMTYVNDYPPAMLFDHPDPEQRVEYWANIYFKPFVHAGPYCVGLLSGYLLATRPKMKISMPVQVLGWCSSIIFCMSVLYGVLGWNRGVDPSLLENMLYSSCNRTAWSLGVAWMVICCATGHGGIVNYILSWKVWIPLGRLTFISYLIHPIVQTTTVGVLRAQIQPTHHFAVWMFCGYLMVTYSTAFAGSMLIEAPFLSMEKVLLSREKKDDDQGNQHEDLKVCSKGGLKSSSSIPSMSESQAGLDNNGFTCKL